jgi:hypothetical protein
MYVSSRSKIIYRKWFLIKTYLTNRIHLILKLLNNKILIKLKVEKIIQIQ